MKSSQKNIAANSNPNLDNSLHDKLEILANEHFPKKNPVHHNSTLIEPTKDKILANSSYPCDNLADLNLTPEEREFLAKGTQMEIDYQRNLAAALELSRLEPEANSNHSSENPLLGDLIDLDLTQEECAFLTNEFLIETENMKNLDRGLELSLQIVSLSDIFDMDDVLKGIQFYEQQISIFQDIVNEPKTAKQSTEQMPNTMDRGSRDEEDGAWGGAPICEMLN